MNTVTVGTADLRQALSSVAPHADPDPDFPPLHRIRLQGDQAGINLTVTATNRYTAGHALVSVEDDSADEYAEEPFRVDMSPTNVKEILTLFKGKAGAGDEPGDTLRLDVDDKHTRVTDTSGLFEGKALTLPRWPDETNFPDVPGLIARALARNDDGLAGVTMTMTGDGDLFHGMAEALAHKGRLVADGTKVALFAAAAKAYEQPLVIEPTGEGKALVISCGESFLGLLMPMRQDDEGDARHAAWRAAWLRRLPELASTP